MLRPGASRFSSAESRLFLLPVPTPSGRWKRVACLLQRAPVTSLKGPLPFPVPEQFSPVAGDTLQTWATGFAPSVYLNATIMIGCPVFSYKGSRKIKSKVPERHERCLENRYRRFQT